MSNWQEIPLLSDAVKMMIPLYLLREGDALSAAKILV